MIDHLTLVVSQFERSRAFYAAALRPLGYELIMEFPGVAGFGVKGKPDFWIAEAQGGGVIPHVAFRAENRAAVAAFYEAAMAAGAKDNGGPGLRPEYHPHYYGAFVLDPDGNNMEAVCHHPE